MEGVVCPAFPGFEIISITTAFVFHLLDANLPEDWSESGGEGGLNKYLYFKRGKRFIITTVYKCTQLRV